MATFEEHHRSDGGEKILSADRAIRLELLWVADVLSGLLVIAAPTSIAVKGVDAELAHATDAALGAMVDGLLLRIGAIPEIADEAGVSGERGLRFVVWTFWIAANESFGLHFAALHAHDGLGFKAIDLVLLLLIMTQATGVELATALGFDLAAADIMLAAQHSF